VGGLYSVTALRKNNVVDVAEFFDGEKN